VTSSERDSSITIQQSVTITDHPRFSTTSASHTCTRLGFLDVVLPVRPAVSVRLCLSVCLFVCVVLRVLRITRSQAYTGHKYARRIQQKQVSKQEISGKIRAQRCDSADELQGGCRDARRRSVLQVHGVLLPQAGQRIRAIIDE